MDYKVKDEGHIHIYVVFFFANNHERMILTLMIDNDETFKLTQGQGHKIKGQGHIRIYIRLLFRS